MKSCIHNSPEWIWRSPISITLLVAIMTSVIRSHHYEMISTPPKILTSFSIVIILSFQYGFFLYLISNILDSYIYQYCHACTWALHILYTIHTEWCISVAPCTTKYNTYLYNENIYLLQRSSGVMTTHIFRFPIN